MSDLKRTCPGCTARTSDVGEAFREGEPCPYCGHEAAWTPDDSEADDLRAALAEVRQQLAEARADRCPVHAPAGAAESPNMTCPDHFHCDGSHRRPVWVCVNCGLPR